MPTSIKKIKGNDYLYYTYHIDGKRYDVYCGLASKSESKKNALKAELRYTEIQIKVYLERQKRLKKIINNDKK